MNKILLVNLLIGFFMSTLSLTASADDFQAAITSYNSAISQGSSGDIKDSIAHFDRILAKDPDNPRATTYKGSLLARLAKVSWMPWNKLSYLNEGIDLMDQGVDRALQSHADPRTVIELRMVRGITSTKIPSVFKRGATAMGDFNAIRTLPSFRAMAPNHQAIVLTYTAILEQRYGRESSSQSFLAQAKKVDDKVATTIWSAK